MDPALRDVLDLRAHLPFNRDRLGARFVPGKGRAAPTAAANARWLVLQDQGLVLPGGEGDERLPAGERPRALALEDGDALYVGDFDGEPVFACTMTKDAALPVGWRRETLVPMQGARLSHELCTLGGIALQHVWWERTSAFCPRCGERTERIEHEWGKRCARCAYEHYPHLHPAAIVLIRDGERALFARRAVWKPGLYALVAGFVDNGESLEGCVEREVEEEVGLRVKDVRYRGSQNWPFPSQLMIGFTAEYAGGELRVDTRELEDARWFERSAPPAALPGKMSISRWLIDRYFLA